MNEEYDPNELLKAHKSNLIIFEKYLIDTKDLKAKETDRGLLILFNKSIANIETLIQIEMNMIRSVENYLRDKTEAGGSHTLFDYVGVRNTLKEEKEGVSS